MESEQTIKDLVRQKYSEIALQGKPIQASSCCGSGGCGTEVYNIMTEDYSSLEGYQQDADLGLGCGLPTEFAKIKPGDTVIDLGSGAGNDCFIARHETGSTGSIIGIDFSEPMILKARENAMKLGFSNVEFRFGDIEEIPVEKDHAHVIISNCVLNLVPNKHNVFREIYRVLKPNGHFSISDIVLEGDLPPKLAAAAELYAGCVSGAIPKEDYLHIIEETGFEQITVQKYREIFVPDDILDRFLSREEIARFRASGTGIFSMNVYGRKPGEGRVS